MISPWASARPQSGRHHGFGRYGDYYIIQLGARCSSATLRLTLCAACGALHLISLASGAPGLSSVFDPCTKEETHITGSKDPVDVISRRNRGNPGTKFKQDIPLRRGRQSWSVLVPSRPGSSRRRQAPSNTLSLRGSPLAREVVCWLRRVHPGRPPLPSLEVGRIRVALLDRTPLPHQSKALCEFELTSSPLPPFS
jgi:hypothetical protein